MKEHIRQIRDYFSNKSNIYIKLTILVPAIFTGISLLSFIVAMRVSEYAALSHSKSMKGFIIWGGLLIIFTFLSGLAITWLIVTPMKEFMKETEKLPVFPDAAGRKKKQPSNEIERFKFVLTEVTQILSKVEARQFFPEIVGESNVMRGLFRDILKVAPTDSTVLLTGESGTGKELIAGSIYKNSLRKEKPFIKLSCVAIPAGLLESELFGHEKGSFTGATSTKIGKFELADGGSILLDEIGDMPLDTQAKLLRVLQEREFERVGGNRSIKVDVRFIAASNQDLESMVKEGKFRSDLYFRLNVISLKVPPLRERKEDIPILVEYFLKITQKDVKVSPLTLNCLIMYDWPGNIRELQNTIERASLVADSGVIEPAHLPANIVSALDSMGQKFVLQDAAIHNTDILMGKGGFRFNSEDVADVGIGQDKNEKATTEGGSGKSIDAYMEDIERNLIIEALRKTGGVQSKAAKLLGIKERSLWHRVKKYNIDTGSFRTN